MGNGWHEWPLVLFTVLGQCVVGATIVSGLGWLALGDQREARRRLVRNMFFIWLLMGIGFLASVMHLGSPLRAFNSLNRIGASALSNEIASGALFFAVGGFWWLLAVLEKRAGYNFSSQDVYVNIIGGLKLDETACDLPVCIAMASSLLDLPVGEKTIAIGEVGLGGEVRSVTHLETACGKPSVWALTRPSYPSTT